MNAALRGTDRTGSDLFEDLACPFSSTSDTCIASLSSMVIDERKKTECCGTENYDSCPVFLSKVLRRR